MTKLEDELRAEREAHAVTKARHEAALDPLLIEAIARVIKDESQRDAYPMAVAPLRRLNIFQARLYARVALAELAKRGIVCRDETIRLQDEHIEALFARAEKAEADLREVDVLLRGVAWTTTSVCKSAAIAAPYRLPEPIVAEDPIDALVDLLAPALTHSQGMAAIEREDRFRKAMAQIALGDYLKEST